MDKDPSSAGNGGVPADQERERQSQDHFPATQHSGAGHVPQAQADSRADGMQFPPQLTAELAQLLAASIAQHGMPGQPAAKPGQGTPTNSELASLAAIMAGTQTVRKPLPPYRDDLSTLSYSRVELSRQGHPPQPLQPPHTSYPQPLAPAHAAVQDDEPMPIPSTWRQPAAHDEDRPFAKQLGAAAMGLAAGLVVVVPAVLWMTGIIGPGKTKGDIAGADVKTVKVRPLDRPAETATYNPGDATLNSPSSAEPATPQALTTASMTKAPILDPAQHVEHLLVQARQRIDSGDVMAAREILAGESAPSAPLLFALAETYDPNMLAAWGSRGISADVQRARALYAKALEQGFGRALPRLDALK